jgi:hypothetical protein
VEVVVGGGDGGERRGRTVPVGEKMGWGRKRGERKGFGVVGGSDGGEEISGRRFR